MKKKKACSDWLVGVEAEERVSEGVLNIWLQHLKEMVLPLTEMEECRRNRFRTSRFTCVEFMGSVKHLTGNVR